MWARSWIVGACLFGAFNTRSEGQWPAAPTVERQPLRAQLDRIRQAFDRVGAALDAATLAKLDKAAELGDDPSATRAIEAAVDPLCIAAVTINGDGPPRVVASKSTAELVEQGWRPLLVKVVNPGGATSRLKVSSPNALPRANAKPADLATRWLEVESFDARPLNPMLGGLPLEYRIIQIYAAEPGTKRATLDFGRGQVALDFTVNRSHEVKFDVKDEDGKPTTAAFRISDDRGHLYPAQGKRLAPDFFFQTQIYRADGETLRLPSGRFQVVASRGPESLPESKDVTIEGPTTIAYRVKRWVDPSKLGWWSGDHHIHAAGCKHYNNPTEGVMPIDMIRQCLGEDLKVGCCLTWGPCFDFQKQFFTGGVDKVSAFPYLLRYDIEVSGFGSHQSGHLCLLRLRDQMYPGGDSTGHWPTLGLNTLAWAKRQGAVTGPAHSANGLATTAERVEGPDGPDHLPDYAIPAYNGIGANEYVVDITHQVPGPDGKPVPAVDFISTMDTDRRHEMNMWYHTLNCGFRVRASGETDFPCITGDRVGGGRVYVKLDNPLDYDAWCEGIRSGRTYVSDGTSHLMDFRLGSAALGENGSTLAIDAPGSLKATAKVAVRDPKGKPVKVEAVVNGYPIASVELPADGSTQNVSLDVPIKTSSWVALRTFPSAHTNPIFVEVAGKPIRPSKRSVAWMAKSVDRCWSQKERFYKGPEHDQAHAAYDHARAVYQKLLAEAEAD